MEITLGAGLLIIALTAQYLISKRLKHQKMSKAISWLAWSFAVVGGTAITNDFGNAIGASSAFCAAASCVGLLFIAVDIADRRPDWLAFILITITPTFMRLSGGGIGDLFDLVLYVPTWAAGQLGTFLGM